MLNYLLLNLHQTVHFCVLCIIDMLTEWKVFGRGQDFQSVFVFCRINSHPNEYIVANMHIIIITTIIYGNNRFYHKFNDIFV